MTQVVRFNKTSPVLKAYKAFPWNLNESRYVEFFPGVFYEVTLISTRSKNLEKYLQKIDDGQPMALDLEWKFDWGPASENEVCLFQICSSKGVLIIRHPHGQGNASLCRFLEVHQLYSKGMLTDKIKLAQKFRKEFQDNIEDIEYTRLRSNNHSPNFNDMVARFAGTPCAEFKSKKVSKSNWEQKSLTMQQVLYAAFDVVALRQAYPNFPPRRDLGSVPKYKCAQIFCYLVSNVTGQISVDFLKRSLPKAHHIATFNYGSSNSSYIFIVSWTDLPLPQINAAIPSISMGDIQELPLKNVDYSNDMILYVTDLNLPQNQAEELFNYLGNNVQIMFDTMCNIPYYTLHVSSSKSAQIIQTFLPYLSFNGISPKIHHFPSFLPMLKVTELPSDITSEELNTSDFFEKAIDVELLPSRSLDLPKSALITFRDTKDRDIGLRFKYARIDDRTVYVTPYVDEFKRKQMKSYQLFINLNDCKPGITCLQIEKEYKEFGDIFNVIIDEEFHVVRIQFYSSSDAELAHKKHEQETYFVKPSQILELSNLSIFTDIKQLCLPFGQILEIDEYDISLHDSTYSADVSFASATFARAAYNGLNAKAVQGKIIQAKSNDTGALIKLANGLIETKKKPKSTIMIEKKITK